MPRHRLVKRWRGYTKWYPLFDNYFNPFTPEFLKWVHPSMNSDISIVANRRLFKINNKMANSVDPDETDRYVPFHLDLHCFYRIRVGL